MSLRHSDLFPQHGSPGSSTPGSVRKLSLSGQNSGSGGGSNLLRSRGLFSSTPSLFSKTSPEEKFWKKELKKAKEEQKKMEGEKKRLEKEEKKEEKKRRKMERKAATISGRRSLSVPGYNYVQRPIETIYVRPRLTAVPINYTDDPRIPPTHGPPQPHYPPPTTARHHHYAAANHYATTSHYPSANHYATPYVTHQTTRPYVAPPGGYHIYSGTREGRRVEQVYGTTSRRSMPAQLSHYASPYGNTPIQQYFREQTPRVVLLHRSAEGYGFVLRGAKSKAPTGGSFNDFTPTAEYPALQYLDSVDPASQADRAGLKGGDFILEINGENVIRSTHEHVVHLIRSSSDVLTLKVVTVTHTDRSADWTTHPDAGAMTLPSRKKQEKLDAALAEFEGSETNRRHSLHGLATLDDSKDAKTASVRASHAVKRVSVLDYEGLEPSGQTTPKGMSPAEARIKKYHKKTGSQTMERSQSTPDILADVESGGIETGTGPGGQTGGSWSKKKHQAPNPVYSSALQASNGAESSRLIAAVAAGNYKRGTSSPQSTPELPNRAPTHQTPPGAPKTPEVVRINTSSKSQSTYANVSADVQARLKKESGFESSFRPGISAKMIDNPPKGGAPDHAILKKTSQNSPRDAQDNVSFAEDRVMENAQKFIKKHPNATVLVTADIHPDKPKGVEKPLYEPEPDYDDTDANNSRGSKLSQNKAVTVISISSNKPKVDMRPTTSSAQTTQNTTNSPRRGSIYGESDLGRGSVYGESDLPSPISKKPGLLVVTAMTSAIKGLKTVDNSQEEEPKPASPASTGPPAPPSSAPPPPPPPPPLSLSGSTDSTLRGGQKTKAPAPVFPAMVTSHDIMSAVAERRARMQSDGPRVQEVKPEVKTHMTLTKSALELNQEALRAAVAKRKSRLDQEDSSVVSEIESRLQKSKKLQAAKYFNQRKPVITLSENTEKEAPSVQPKETVVKPKLSPAVPVKTYKTLPAASKDTSPSRSNVTTLDLRSKLKPVEIKSGVSPLTSNASSAPRLKAPAPPPPPPQSAKTTPPPVPVAVNSPPVLNTKLAASTKPEQNNGSPTTNSVPTSPTSTANYIALAEKARQEYLKKKAAGNIKADIEKKGPVEITPTRKNSSRSPHSPTTTNTNAPKLIQVKPASSSGEPVQVSIKDRIKTYQSEQPSVPMSLKGVTEDHSHTEQTLSNGTIKVKSNGSNGSASPPSNLINPTGDNGLTPPPPPGFADSGTAGKGVFIDIIPPPSSFSSGDSPDDPTKAMPAFGQDDAASFVSSVSSLSTLSSEHGEATSPERSIEDLIAPPPPNFGDDANLNNHESFVPPPPMFLELDNNANINKSSDKNAKAFAVKSVSSWSCLDVLDWLESLGLPQYRVTFAKASVDGSKLVDMGRNEFISLGVTQVGHRMNLERSVKKLALAASTNL